MHVAVVLNELLLMRNASQLIGDQLDDSQRAVPSIQSKTNKSSVRRDAQAFANPVAALVKRQVREVLANHFRSHELLEERARLQIEQGQSSPLLGLRVKDDIDSGGFGFG